MAMYKYLLSIDLVCSFALMFQNSRLESEHLVIKSAMQMEEKGLRQARDRNLELEQENDSLREKIAAL